MRGLETEFGESTNAIRQELNRFEEASMLTSLVEGNKKFFTVNNKHPLFNDIQNIIKKFIGVDVIIENIANRLGDLEAVYLTGNLAQGKDDQVIDLVLIGNPDKQYLIQLIDKSEKLIARRIRYIIYAANEQPNFELLSKEYLLLWNK
ncbi:MAG: ArsR family transcriptional regulator [Bacteroidota bacterium]|nr:ArsR family transcriptional regulator [Bacteroidota bacterium]